MNKVKPAEKTKRVPSLGFLKHSGVAVVAQDALGDGGRLTVFQNGMVACQNDRHTTVFPLHECRDYLYLEENRPPRLIPYAVFRNQPWQIRLFMEGHDRITRNREKAIQQRVVSFDAFEYDFIAAPDGRDAFENLEDDDTWRKLRIALQKLSEEEQYTLIQCAGHCRTRRDVARDLQVQRQTVDWYYDRAVRRMKKKLKRLKIS